MNLEKSLKAEPNDNFLNEMDKKIGASIKDKAWAEVEGHISEIQRQIGKSANSNSDKNWRRDKDLEATAPASNEKKLARAVADGFGWVGYLAELPTCLGLLGLNKARVIDLAAFQGTELCFYDFKAAPAAEDIRKALRQLIVVTVFYRAFLAEPAKFGYDTGKSPLLMEEPILSWELVAPLDMLNPRKSDMRWGERDAGGIQAIMKQLGVKAFSMSRLQASSEALQNNINKDNFSAMRARQWFENRTPVLLA